MIEMIKAATAELYNYNNSLVVIQNLLQIGLLTQDEYKYMTQEIEKDAEVIIARLKEQIGREQG